MEPQEEPVAGTRACEDTRTKTGGRPRKFPGRSRPITVTLPETTLSRLTLVDPDRALAIAKATEIATTSLIDHDHTVEVIEIERGSGLIVVGPNESLRRIPWLRMVQVSPARFLLSIPPGTSVDSLEIAVLDLIDHLPAQEADERMMLIRLRDLMRSLRREQSVSKAEILIVRTRT